MGKIGVDDLEDLRTLRLEDESREELLAVATECIFVFAGEEGWPGGVVMSFLYADDAFWLTRRAPERTLARSSTTRG